MLFQVWEAGGLRVGKVLRGHRCHSVIVPTQNKCYADKKLLCWGSENTEYLGGLGQETQGRLLKLELNPKAQQLLSRRGNSDPATTPPSSS